MVEYGGTFPGAYLLRRGVFMPWELDRVLDRETARIGLERLRPLALVASALVPEPEVGLRQGRRARSLPLHAQPAPARYGLGEHGPRPGGARTAGRQPAAGGRCADPPHDGAPQGKKALAAAPRIPLPEAVLKRVKTGFTTPIASWLQRMPGQRYTSVPMLAAPNCRWARRWAYCIAASETLAPATGVAA